MAHRSVVAGRPAEALLLLFGMLFALAVIATLALAALGARGETGGPVLGGDGVWRASGDWSVDPADRLTYANVTIEAAANVTVRSGGQLTLQNVTLNLTGAAMAERAVLVEVGGVLTLLNTTLTAQSPGQAVVVRGTLDVEFSTLNLGDPAGLAACIRVDRANLTLVSTLVVTAPGATAVRAQASDFHTFDADFATSAGGRSDLALEMNGSYVFDTSNFGVLHTTGVGRVQLYSTARFLVLDPQGNATAGRVNGTGIRGEPFFTDADVLGRTRAIRLLMLDFAPTDGAHPESERRSALPAYVTAVATGLGGNTTAFFLDAARVNLTLVLDRPWNLGIVFAVIPDAQLASRPRPVYYADLGTNVTMEVRVHNAGERASPAASLAVTQWTADPSSWVNRESRTYPAVPIPALLPGESANLSFLVPAEAWGGQEERRTPCFYSLSYSTNIDLRTAGAESGDFGPWNDAVALSMRAFRVVGNETAPCNTGGEALLPYIVLGIGGALAGVWLVTRYFSSSAEERRAARRAEREARAASPPNAPPRRNG